MELRAKDACVIVGIVHDKMAAMVSLGRSDEIPGPDSKALFREVKGLYKRIYRLKPPVYYDKQINDFVEEGIKRYFGGYDED